MTGERALPGHRVFQDLRVMRLVFQEAVQDTVSLAITLP